MSEDNDQPIKVGKGYKWPWSVIPIVPVIALAVSLLVFRILYCRGLQYDSREQIAQTLLEATPRGTSRAIVRRFVDSKGWGRGGLIRATGGPDRDPVDRISVYLGKARGFIMDQRVYAEWIFDGEDKLIGVQVYKVTLGP
jgi:hypothetical protein